MQTQQPHTHPEAELLATVSSLRKQAHALQLEQSELAALANNTRDPHLASEMYLRSNEKQRLHDAVVAKAAREVARIENPVGSPVGELSVRSMTKEEALFIVNDRAVAMPTTYDAANPDKNKLVVTNASDNKVYRAIKDSIQIHYDHLLCEFQQNPAVPGGIELLLVVPEHNNQVKLLKEMHGCQGSFSVRPRVKSASLKKKRMMCFGLFEMPESKCC